MRSKRTQLILAFAGLTHAGVMSPIHVAHHNPLDRPASGFAVSVPGGQEGAFAFSLLSGLVSLALAVGGLSDPDDDHDKSRPDVDAEPTT